MIVGITGTSAPFPRLVQLLAAHAKLTAEKVWVQYGGASLVPGVDGAPVLPRSELLAKMALADAVVCHAGCGTLADAFSLGHVPIVVARRAHLGEHVNDHQLELLDALDAERRILAFRDGADLASLVREARARRGAPARPATLQRLIDALSEELRAPAPRPAPLRHRLMESLTRLVPVRRI